MTRFGCGKESAKLGKFADVYHLRVNLRVPSSTNVTNFEFGQKQRVTRFLRQLLVTIFASVRVGCKTLKTLRFENFAFPLLFPPTGGKVHPTARRSGPGWPDFGRAKSAALVSTTTP